MTLITTV